MVAVRKIKWIESKLQKSNKNNLFIKNVAEQYRVAGSTIFGTGKTGNRFEISDYDE